jgi:hypothetical protein
MESEDQLTCNSHRFKRWRRFPLKSHRRNEKRDNCKKYLEIKMRKAWRTIIGMQSKMGIRKIANNNEIYHIFVGIRHN